MNATDPPPAGRTRTTRYLRVVFGLAAFGMAVQWFDRLDGVLSGGSAGWPLVWNLVCLCFLPLGAVYFACRAVLPASRDAAPDPPAPR